MTKKYDSELGNKALKVLEYMLSGKGKAKYRMLPIDETVEGIINLIELIRKEDNIMRKFWSDEYGNFQCKELQELVNKELEEELTEDYIERIYFNIIMY